MVDLSAASGGLLFAVIAGLWLLVLVPSWLRGSQEREAKHDQTTSMRAARREVLHPEKKTAPTRDAVLAKRAHRLESSRRVALGLAAIGFLASILLVPAAISSPSLWPVSASVILGALVSLATARRLFVLHGFVLAESAQIKRSRPQAFEPAAQPKAVEAEKSADENTWERNPLPAPTYAPKIGAMEIPVLAEVVELEPKKQTVISSEELDQILLRRRSNG